MYISIFLTKTISMKDQLSGLIRHALTAVGGFIVAKGLVEDSLIQDAIGAIMTLVGIIWSVAAKKKAA
jgi:hypothetical protein